MLEFLFKYPEVTYEVTEETGRHYSLVTHRGEAFNGLPSVTTILSKFNFDGGAIEAWRKAVGDEKADAVTKESTDRGTLMHDLINHMIMCDGRLPEGKYRQNFKYKIALKMANNIMALMNAKCDLVWGAEVPLVFPDRYAGRADCIGLWKGVPSIIDFKNASKPKDIEHIRGYFYQCAAYALAHDWLFDTSIDQCVILICNAYDFEVDEVVVNGNDFLAIKIDLLERIEELYRNNVTL